MLLLVYVTTSASKTDQTPGDMRRDYQLPILVPVPVPERVTRYPGPQTLPVTNRFMI